VIDVFIRSYTPDAVRKGLADACIARWQMEPDARVHVLESDTDELYATTTLRTFSERNATSDPYVFTDDDVMILGKDWLKIAENVLKEPFGVLSTLSIVEGENSAKAPFDLPDRAAYEMHAVGAPSIIRKGIFTDLPPMTIGNECGTLHKICLDKGYRMGLIKGLRHSHLGHGLTIYEPGLRWGV